MTTAHFATRLAMLALFGLLSLAAGACTDASQSPLSPDGLSARSGKGTTSTDTTTATISTSTTDAVVEEEEEKCYPGQVWDPRRKKCVTW